MNHPTNEVDDLLSMADEAVADGDFSEAVCILRRAKSVAPLRKDIRNRLADALAGVPDRVSSSSSAPTETATSFQIPNEPGSAFMADPVPQDYAPEEYFDLTAGRDAVSDVARKAFRAAAGTTARAGAATGQLSNLLKNGIQSWKSSMLDQITSARVSVPVAATKNEGADGVSEVTEAGIFSSSEDISQYLPPSAATITHFPPPAAHVENIQEDIEPDVPEETERIVKPNRKSAKSFKASSGKRNSSGQTDVEDVIAAGIGGFIDAVGRADKRKIAYGMVYFAMGALFTLACVDVSKKFPAVAAVQSVGSVQAASLGGLDLAPQSRDNPLEEARALAKSGKAVEAADILRTALSTRLQPNAEQLKIELGAQLNIQAEEKLRNNQLSQSTDLYRQAVEVLPTDDSLQLRLANALYYQAVMDPTGGATQKDLLTEATAILEKLTTKNTTNIQVYRVLALVNEADGNSLGAKAAWQKVKTMASAGSPEHKEAISHLK